MFGVRVVSLVRISEQDTVFQSIRLRLFRKKNWCLCRKKHHLCWEGLDKHRNQRDNFAFVKKPANRCSIAGIYCLRHCKCYRYDEYLRFSVPPFDIVAYDEQLASVSLSGSIWSLRFYLGSWEMLYFVQSIYLTRFFGACVVHLVRIVVQDTVFQSIRLRLFRIFFAIFFVERSTISAESATTSIAINETVSPSATSRTTSAASLESTVFSTVNATGMMNSWYLSVPAV